MNKGEFIKAVAEKTGITQKDIEEVFGAGLTVLSEQIKRGEKIAFVGFGTFELKKRAARTGINPQTKKPIKIAAAKTPAFKVSKAWKDSFN